MKTIKILGDTLNKVTDTSAVFKFRLWNDGLAQDVTGKTVSVTIANASGYLFDVTPKNNGTEVELDFSDAKLKELTPDTYKLEINVTNADGDIEVYPSNGAVEFLVTRNLKSQAGTLVPQVTFDAVLEGVDKKIADYIASGKAKGDKGDPGEISGTIGGRNYILNSKATYTTGAGNFPTSVPISFFSNKTVTLSAQVDYDNVTAVSGNGRVGVEFVMKNSDTQKNAYIGAWSKPKVGDSFHGRVSETIDFTGIKLDSANSSTPNVLGQGVYFQGVTGTNVAVSNIKFEIGATATDWTPAPEDKADDSRVVHTIGNETIHDNKVFDGSVMFKGDIKPVDLGNYHVDGITNAGTYKSYGNIQGLPGQAYGVLEVVKNDTDVLQRYTQTNTDTPFTWQRLKNNNIGGWSNWISVTTANTLSSQEINNDQSLIDLNTDKAIYNPYERVEFEGYVSSNLGKIKVEYYRREVLIDTQTIPFMAGIVNWSWYLPSADKEQYYAKVTVITNSGEGNPQYVAINVDSSGKNIPIMGFLSLYGEYNPNNEKKVINDLKRHHINYIQYYDCYERPEHLIRTNLTGEDSQAGTAADYWKDLARRQIRADVLREYINLGKKSGIKNMLYVPWGNTSHTSGDGITKEMLLFNDGYKSVDGDLSAVTETLSGGDGKWARYSLMQANPGHSAFKNMLFGSAQKALEVMGFDGLHIDTLGPNYGNTYTFGGISYGNEKAAEDMPSFINDASSFLNTDSWKKQGSNIRMSFNNVGSWGIDNLANNVNLDFLYAEQWPDMGNKTYGDMIKKIMDINNKSSWQRVVIPAYMHKDATGSSSTFNTNGVILTNLVIMASGATHIELGEHMLCSEYFANNSLFMNDDLKNWETKYYDFLVAYSRMFNIKNYTSNTFSASHKILHNDFSRDFEITAIEQEDDYLSAVSLINTKDINGDDWRDSNFDRNEPTKLTNVGLGFKFKPKAVYYCTIENPQPKKLVPDDNNYVFIPEVDRYTLVYAYK